MKSEKELFAIREAEIKHGRIALLAAVGWPISELYHYTLAKSLGMEDLLAPVSIFEYYPSVPPEVGRASSECIKRWPG